MDDDHDHGLIDKAMWVRQRARMAERIEATRREDTTSACTATRGRTST